jgi:hypothetical protein
MHDLTAKRTLVKSPPELWSELSELERLATHLGAFGEIKITKLEPEHTVAWEGESASGTVSIEPSGWGTKVTLTAQLEGEEAVVEEAAAAEQAAVVVEEEAAVEEAPPVEDPPAVEEAVHVEEPVAIEEPVAPVQAEPEGRRGFLGWLFRKRTSAQAAGPEVGLPAEPTASVLEQAPIEEPVAEAPEIEAPALEEPAVEEPAVEEPTAEEPGAEEPAVEEPVAEEPPVEEPAVEEPDAQEAPRAGLDPEHAQAVLDEVLDALGSAHHRPFSRG